MDTRRKPLVESVLKDAGKGFMFGALFSAVHYVKYDMDAVFKNVPRMSGSAAVCFGAYTAIDHAMVSARGKEEPFLDCAVAAAGASAITTLPRGLRFAGTCALVGGVVGGVAFGGWKFLELEAEAIRRGRGDP